jgi:predicted transcriptional regulator
MDFQATKLELIKLLMSVENESLLQEIKSILKSNSNSVSEEILVYTTKGEPLTKEEYLAKIQQGIDDIEAGRVISHEDLLNEIKTWK